MARADRNGERVATAARGEVDNLFGLRVVALGSDNVVLNTGKHTEFSLDSHVVLVSILNHLLRDGDVLFVRQSAAVEHNAREAHVDAVLADFKTVTVVEVEHDFRMSATQFLSVGNSAFGHVAQDGGVGIVASTFRHLHDDGRLCLDSSHDDGLHLFHCVEVEGRDGISTLDGSCKHIARVYKTKIFVINHTV